MKFLLLLNLVLFTSACTTLSKQEVKPLLIENVCSEATVQYAKLPQGSLRPGQLGLSKEVLSARINKLWPSISRCYNQELNRGRLTSINLCLATGFDNEGTQEFFEFSSREQQLSEEFSSCLAEIRIDESFQGLYGVKIIQGYQLRPTVYMAPVY